MAALLETVVAGLITAVAHPHVRTLVRKLLPPRGRKPSTRLEDMTLAQLAAEAERIKTWAIIALFAQMGCTVAMMLYVVSPTRTPWDLLLPVPFGILALSFACRASFLVELADERRQAAEV